MANFDAQGRELFKCPACNKRQTSEGYEVDRHGHRRKTCNDCKAKREASKCEHNRRRHICKDCGGAGLCKHNRQRSVCKDCGGGASICEHNRLRRVCKDCGGAGLCEHNRHRSECRDCNGVSICEHGRKRRLCKECGGSGICEHGRQRHVCKDCGGASICEHNRLRHRCKDCGGNSICEHDRERDQCRECNPVGHLRNIVSGHIRHALKSDKDRGSLDYLGCSIETLRWHIGQQFEPGMTWETYGSGPDTWQIDHIVPIKYPGKDGGAPTLDEVTERLHWTNCQPLWTTDNIAKGNRFIGRERPQAVVPANETPKLSDTDIDELLFCLLVAEEQ